MDIHKKVKICVNKIEKNYLLYKAQNNFLYLWKKDKLCEQVFIQNWRIDKFL